MKDQVVGCNNMILWYTNRMERGYKSEKLLGKGWGGL